MLLRDAVQLPGDLRKVLIQVQCADADFVAAHVIDMIRLHLLIGFGIKKHTGYLWLGMIRAGKLRFLIFHIGEDLIQIAGMERVHVVLHLRRMGILIPVISNICLTLAISSCRLFLYCKSLSANS